MYSTRPPKLCRGLFYLLTNGFAYLYGRIQSPRPDVMPDRREGITRAAGFVFACIDSNQVFGANVKATQGIRRNYMKL